MNVSTLYSAIGLTGMGLFLAAYFLLQQGKIHSESLAYSLMNLCGALLILVSFIDQWNLAAFLLEVAWGLISVYGIWKYVKRRKRTPNA